MACNGHNHPKGCTCNFRGGHPNSQPPAWRGWGRSAARHYVSGPNASCPECKAPVYFIPGPKGGGTFFDCIGPPWTKHPCTNNPKPYSPFNKKGLPKLRNRHSEFERDGWLPFVIRNIEQLAVGTIVHGVALDNPTVLHFGFLEAIKPDKHRPIFFRYEKSDKSRIEFNCFAPTSSEAKTLVGFDDCRADFDLLIKKR